MNSEKTASEANIVTIKKYANRRLYNTGNSAYVTLEDLADMVKKGQDFLVFDAKTSEDITRSVLTQIIFEQEGKEGQSLLPITFLRQLIRFYGDSMQWVVPSYLEFSIGKLTDDQQKFRDQFTRTFAGHAVAQPTLQMFDSLEEQTRKNMALFSQAMSLFNPFLANPAAVAARPSDPAAPPAHREGDIEDIKREVNALQKRLEDLGRKS